MTGEQDRGGYVWRGNEKTAEERRGEELGRMSGEQE